MKIPVLLFGPQATRVGAREVVVTVDAEAPTAGQVLAALAVAAPEIADSLGASRLAVNHEFAEPDHPIKPGDEVALIGMVSGG